MPWPIACDSSSTMSSVTSAPTARSPRNARVACTDGTTLSNSPWIRCTVAPIRSPSTIGRARRPA